MKCKKCKNKMSIIDKEFDDGNIAITRKCKCGIQSKTWYNLEDIVPAHIHWLNNEGEDY